MMAMWGTYYAFGIFFKPVLTEFGWTRAMISGAFSLSSFLAGLVAIVTGRLNDRFGPRLVIATCGFFLGLGYLLMSQISAIWQLYLFYGVIIGIGMSGSLVPLLSTVARWFVRRRAMMTGIVTWGLGIGSVIMPLLARWLISNYGWSNSYIIVGSIALVLIVLAAQFLRRDPGQMELSPYGENEVKAESLNLEASGFSLQEAIHTWQFWILCILQFFFIFCVNTVMVHIAPHAMELGIPMTTSANILAATGGLGIVGMVVMGAFADRAGNKQAMIISFILMSVALFWVVVAKEVWMLYLFAVIFGFGFGGMSALFSPMTAELFGLRSHGVILGIGFFCSMTGGAIGPLQAGYVFDIIGSYNPAFLVCAAFAATGVILTIWLRPIGSGGGQNDSVGQIC